MTKQTYRVTGCSYFSALLVLQANIFEDPLADSVDVDLQLTSFAVGVLNKMSDASTLMAMKRMNVVATELDSRARSVVDEARRAVAAGWRTQLEPRSVNLGQRCGHSSASGQTTAAQLQWDWGNDGVDAWPRMDFFLVSIRRGCRQDWQQQ